MANRQLSFTIEQKDIQAAMKHGFNFVCAFCVKLHAGKHIASVEWPRTVCLGQRCWGPMGGSSYPEYEGPLGDNLVSHCFRCGEQNPGHVVASMVSPDRKIGCCGKHLDLLKSKYQAKHGKRVKSNGVNSRTPMLVDGGWL